MLIGSPGALIFSWVLLVPQQDPTVVGDDGFGRPPSTREGERPTSTPTPPPVLRRAAGPDGDDVQVSTPDPNNQNEVLIAVDPTNRDHLIGGANDNRGTDYTCAFYASFDGGLNWNELLYPVPPVFDAAGDPALAFGPGGETYFCSLAFDRSVQFSSIFVGESFDGGLTVPTWVEAVDSPVGAFEDKQLLTTDRSGGALDGALYVTWTRFENGLSDNSIHMVSSFDGGAIWSTPIRLSESATCQGSAPAVGPGSELYVAFYEFGGLPRIMIDRSLDGGLTWGIDQEVTLIDPIFGTPGSSFRANSFPNLAIDCSGGPHDGNLYIVYAEDPAGHVDIKFTRSTDGGTTWSTPLLVNDDGTTNSQFFPSIQVDVNGNINVGFYDRRDDPADRHIAYYVARSSNGGVSFQPNVLVSDVTFDPNTYSDGFFIGDYTGITASDRTVHPIWCDGRNSTNDVFSTRVQLDFFGAEDSISATTGGAVNFTLNPGPLYAGEAYRILGSATGTSPGLTFNNGLNLPLNFDALLWTTLLLANTPPLQGFAGNLNVEGSATATLDTLGPFDPTFAGATLHFAGLVASNGKFEWASNPYAVELVP